MKVEVGETYIVKESAHAYFKGNVFTVDMFDFTNNKVHITFRNGAKYQEDVNIMELLSLDVCRQHEPSKPAHYDTGIDTIAFMRANFPPEQVEGFLRGNALKYLQRYDRKLQALSDLKKCRHYLDMLIEEVEGRE